MRIKELKCKNKENIQWKIREICNAASVCREVWQYNWSRDPSPEWLHYDRLYHTHSLLYLLTLYILVRHGGVAYLQPRGSLTAYSW